MYVNVRENGFIVNNIFKYEQGFTFAKIIDYSYV